MKAIGQLAGGVAHDFNNILMGILGNATLVQKGFDPGDPNYTRLGQIEEHVKRGSNLTRQLLGFARDGKYEVKTLSANDLIRKSARLFLETRKDIEAEFLLADDLLPVDADAGHAMPKGGILRIRTNNTTLREAEAKAFEMKAGKYVEVSITDTGTGMDRETLDKVFDPFFTTKSEEGGTGLGLASAYGIIRNHGGFINVHSEPGHGATFNIFLPSSGKEVAKEERESDRDFISGSGGILLVDDEPMILESVSTLLETLGYTVYRAEKGPEAVSVYREMRDRIDLVILSSGYGLQDDVRDVMEMGCQAFVQKPYKCADLSRIVHQVIAQPATRH